MATLRMRVAQCVPFTVQARGRKGLRLYLTDAGGAEGPAVEAVQAVNLVVLDPELAAQFHQGDFCELELRPPGAAAAPVAPANEEPADDSSAGMTGKRRGRRTADD